MASITPIHSLTRRGAASPIAVMALMMAVWIPASRGSDEASGYKGFVRGEALITPGELKDLVDRGDEKLVVIGVVRAGLTGSFTRGHIPGSISVWRPDYTTAEGDPYPYGGMMVNRAQFQEFARSLGVDNDSTVALYDEELDATRLWWAFYLYGKTDVRILDGGYQAWKAAGYATERGGGRERGSREGNFVAQPPLPGWVWSMEDVWRAKSDLGIQVWDTREPDEWSGKKLLSGATRKGRVPWAEFLNWKDFRKKVGGKTPTEFKSAREIQSLIDRHGMDKTKHQLFYCHVGVRTTTEIFALYLLGWDLGKLHNYDGSWVQWSYHEKNPAHVD